MRIWNQIEDDRAGYFWSLSDAILVADNQHQILSDLNGTDLILASDYSGQHKGATHEAYSFLVSNRENLESWLPNLREFRANWLPDGRRLSFKKLNESVRRRSLFPFLEAAFSLRGNLITFLVDNRVESFMSGGGDKIIELFPDCFLETDKSHTAEKMFRIAGMLGLINAGLRKQSQASIWISDHDEILETYDRREGFGRLASYLNFGMTGWQNSAGCIFATTEDENSEIWWEDFLAIPDIIAGTFCKLAPSLPARFPDASELFVTRPIGDTDLRAVQIGNWLSAHAENNLRQMLVRLELDKSGMPRATAQSFIGRMIG